MAILKLFNKKPSDQEKQAAQDKEKQVAQENLVAQHRANTIHELCDLILDLESLYHNDFRNGLNQVDLQIVQRCKYKISECFDNLDLYNLFLRSDVEQYIRSKKIERNDWYETDDESGKVKIFHYIDDYPRFLLDFKPRDIENTKDSLEKVNQDNARVQQVVSEINSILAKQQTPSIFKVRQKYTSKDDGFLIHLKFPSDLTIQAALSQIDDFTDTVKHLSLDELMISQQFTESFRISQDNPYSLQVDSDHKIPQSIRISVQNLKDYAPCYYLTVVLENIKEAINNLKDANDSKTEINLSKSYETINDCFVSMELTIKLEANTDE